LPGVIGNWIATKKNQRDEGSKLMLLQPIKFLRWQAVIVAGTMVALDSG